MDDNLKALEIEFTASEMNLLNEIFKIGGLNVEGNSTKMGSTITKW